MSPPFGFDRGFDTYFSYSAPPAEKGTCLPQRFDGEEVFRRATMWLRNRERRPFFLLVHTYDVHDRCPFQSVADKPFEPWSPQQTDGHAKMRAYYDDLITKTDARVGGLLEELKVLGIADTTLVIVTSDHGELFGEHNLRGHGCPLKPYEQLIHVPLIMRWPARLPAGRRFDEPVSLVAVAPSVLKLTNLSAHPSMDAMTLFGLNLPEPAVRPATYVHCGDLLAVRRGNTKLITSRSNAFPDEIYDLGTDPTDSANRADATGEDAERLRQDASAYWAKVPAEQNTAREAPLDLDPETRGAAARLGVSVRHRPMVLPCGIA